MNRLDMESKNIIDNNIDIIRKIFPNCFKENAIDFDILKQELSNHLVVDKKEKYELTWPGKKESILISNSSTTNTLLPVISKYHKLAFTW